MRSMITARRTTGEYTLKDPTTNVNPTFAFLTLNLCGLKTIYPEVTDLIKTYDMYVSVTETKDIILLSNCIFQQKPRVQTRICKQGGNGLCVHASFENLIELLNNDGQ